MLTVAIEHKRFAAGNDLIRDLNFQINPGEQVALVGPSGAGKSTLLNMIVGLDAAYRGEITLPDQPGGVTMMFQEPRLMPWLTVRDNVLLVGDESTETEQRAIALLSAVGLSDAVHLYPNQLSGGMKKRVALVRAFLPQPKFLLMDEPFGSLDAPAANQLRELAKRLCRQQSVTLICVTHDLSEAITLADRILFFSKDPMQLVLDQSISQWKNFGPEEFSNSQISERLLTQFPNLLRGII